MDFLRLARTASLAALVCGLAFASASAQAPATDPHHPNAGAAPGAAPAEPGKAAANGHRPEPLHQGTTPHGMMGQQMHGMMQSGMAGVPMRMHGHMTKIIFAIADTDGDGGLSFGELTSIQKRIFDQVDGNKDEKVTPEEVEAFMRE